MPRFISARSAPCFLFNMVRFVNKFIASVASLAAAIFHAFGLDTINIALDVMVGTLVLGLAMSAAWLILRFVFGIELETAKDHELIANRRSIF